MRKSLVTLLLGLGLAATSLGCSREYALAALEGMHQGASAPITTCRTTHASRNGNTGTYTTCNTIGGY